MKKILLTFFLLIISWELLIWVGLYNTTIDADGAVNRITIESGQKIAKKNNMSIAGIGGSILDGITGISLDFDRYGPPLDRKAARNLIIDCINQLTTNINQDHEIRKFLSVFPFPQNKCSIAIFNHNQDGYDFHDPEISIIAISGGEIRYLTIELGQKGRYKTEVTETYEEAVAILRASSV
jgi:hypothetical protein